jgi:hypothetical protein
LGFVAPGLQLYSACDGAHFGLNTHAARAAPGCTRWNAKNQNYFLLLLLCVRHSHVINPEY